jgi:hypothetical protein
MFKQTVMRKYSILFLSALTLGSFAFVFTSCDDDEPPAKPKLSFATATITAKESDDNLQIEVVLDKAASEDITIEYSLSGTALDDVTAGNNQDPDYEVVSDFGEVEIEEGQTSGIIELNLLSDGEFEEDETIEISIDNVSSENIELTREDEVNVTLQQEDGLIILLEWPEPSASGQADMDIILRVGDNTTTWTGVLSGAAQGSFEGPEVLFIPKAVTFAAYGLSYVYYDGTLDPLEFTSTFIEFANGAVEAEAQRESFTGVYTAVNKNKWTDVNTTIVVQTFQKNGDAFTSPSSPITIPPTGSRMSSGSTLTSTIKKQFTVYPMSEKIKAMLK